MKIPFDVKFRPQIDSGEYKVETEEGSPARMLCWSGRKSAIRQLKTIIN